MNRLLISNMNNVYTCVSWIRHYSRGLFYLSSFFSFSFLFHSIASIFQTHFVVHTSAHISRSTQSQSPSQSHTQNTTILHVNEFFTIIFVNKFYFINFICHICFHCTINHIWEYNFQRKSINLKGKWGKTMKGGWLHASHEHSIFTLLICISLSHSDAKHRHDTLLWQQMNRYADPIIKYLCRVSFLLSLALSFVLSFFYHSIYVFDRYESLSEGSKAATIVDKLRFV